MLEKIEIHIRLQQWNDLKQLYRIDIVQDTEGANWGYKIMHKHCQYHTS